ncbi:MAG: Translation initiation factor IF-2 [Calditrichaeota bacterium]|nr:Translation initiation factor IF-2 [Calditrichota bacterium]
MAAGAKKRKLFQVAKELKLATDTLIEELKANGFEVTKKQMTPVDDDMYGLLLQKFDPDRWHELQEEAAHEESQRKAEEAQKAREAELQKILETSSSGAKTRETPSVRRHDPGEFRRASVEQEPEAGDEDSRAAERERAGEEKAPPVRPGADGSRADEEADAGERRRAKKPADRSTPSVRGGVSNEDILSLTPPPAPPQDADVPIKPKREKKPKVAEDEEERRTRRKRRRKPTRDVAEKRTGGGHVTAGDAAAPKKRRRKKEKKKKPDAAEVEAQLRQTLAAMESGGGRKKRKRKVRPEVGIVDEDQNLLRITEFISTQELANLMDVQVSELIKECLMLGLRVTINQRLERDTIQLLAEEHGYHVEFVDDMQQQEMIAESEEEDEDEGELLPRPPVVTVMGHVDHGKTTLLDHIRHTRVAEGEAGGITQHIGAYEIDHNEQKITFLDTPGHEAFTAMRARGAQVTDIVVLVVAADDQVMPQTIEAIDHAKAAEVPIVVAINKMDKPGANAEKVRQQLADHGVLVEDWGGDVQASEVSAKQGENIDELLDNILIAAEMLELKAPRETTARGYVIESRLEKGRGTVCTVLVQKGTLRIGDVFVTGPYFGRVRAMFDERGRKREQVLPGQPALITGFEGAPHVGDQLIVFKDEREAREIATKRQQQLREQEMRMREGVSGRDRLLTFVEGQEKAELNLIIKGDVDGSVEAIADSLMRLTTEEVEVKIIHRGVGPMSESDILLASASNAMIIGFNVHPTQKAREMAQLHEVTVDTYRVIYELIEDVKGIIIGMHKAETAEEVTGYAEVRNTFKISRIGTIAGCYVTEGKIGRDDKVRLLRDGTELYQGKIDTLKRFKDDVKHVAQGYECGIKIANYNDIKLGDTLQCYRIVEVEREIEVGTGE